MADAPSTSTSAGLNGEPFDRSRWYVAGASPEATAEEQRRVEICESYIRSAQWSDGTPVAISALVAMNVRGAWPVAYTQGWNDGFDRAASLIREAEQARQTYDEWVGRWRSWEVRRERDDGPAMTREMYALQEESEPLRRRKAAAEAALREAGL